MTTRRLNMMMEMGTVIGQVRDQYRYRDRPCGIAVFRVNLCCLVDSDTDPDPEIPFA